MIHIYYYHLLSNENPADFIERIHSLRVPIDVSQILTYKNRKVQLTKLIGRYTLYLALHTHFGITPEEFILGYNPHGKPYLKKRTDIHFNISHSGEYIVWAVANQPLGIDIERFTTARMQVVQRYFSSDECRKLESTPQGELRDKLFTRLWAAKESYLKFTGKGISGSLPSFTIHLNNGEGYIEKEKQNLPLQLYAITQIEDYACFLTYEANTPTLIRINELKQLTEEAIREL